MFKLLNIQFFIIIIIAASAEKKGQKSSSDVIENLRNKFPDEIFDRLAMKKQLYHVLKEFRDIFLERQNDNKVQFGHVFENPIGWEQRFEEKDFLENRHRGKVKWANVNGGYGEHYWDLNH